MNKKKLLIIVGSLITVITAIIIFLLMSNKKTITHNITFVTNNGSSVESQVVNEGEQVKKPTDPTKDGYMFVEWIYKGKTYDFSLEVTSDLTLTARWIKVEEDIETFSVKFETDGGTTISNQIVEKGNKIAKPIDPVKEGYTFEGWMLDGEVYDFEKVVESNIELKAKWEKEKEKETDKKTTNSNANNNENNSTTKPEEPAKPVEKKYTVTFNSNGGTAVNSQTITEGGKASRPNNPTRTGYTFEGWMFNGNAYDFNRPVNTNIILTAKWTENTKNKYTVTFNSNGGTAINPQTVTEGSKASNPNSPTKAGYNFGGWLLNGNTYDFNSPVNGNITLTAKWNQKTYVIKMSAVDDQSPDRKLTVYQDGVALSSDKIREIKQNGYTLCTGSNMTVNKYQLKSGNSVVVVLSDGTSVTASVQ